MKVLGKKSISKKILSTALSKCVELWRRDETMQSFVTVTGGSQPAKLKTGLHVAFNCGPYHRYNSDEAVLCVYIALVPGVCPLDNCENFQSAIQCLSHSLFLAIRNFRSCSHFLKSSLLREMPTEGFDWKRKNEKQNFTKVSISFFG